MKNKNDFQLEKSALLDFAPLGQDFPALRLSSNLTSLLRRSLICIRSAYAKSAFSFAETLTTLTLIGIVSAILIPTINIVVTNHKNVAILKRMYSDFSINIQTVLNHANSSSISGLRKYGKNTSVDANLKNLHNGAFADATIIKFQGECPTCFIKNSIMPPEMQPIRDGYDIIRNPDGTYSSVPTGRDAPANFSSYKYDNGSAVAIFDYQGNCTTGGRVFFQRQETYCPAGGTCRMRPVGGEIDVPVCGMVVFDVNGEKAPNLPGKDRFGYFIIDEPLDDSYLVPMGYNYDDYDKNKSSRNKEGYIKSIVAGNQCRPNDRAGAGYNCTAKVMLNNWKINY